MKIILLISLLGFSSLSYSEEICDVSKDDKNSYSPQLRDINYSYVEALKSIDNLKGYFELRTRGEDPPKFDLPINDITIIRGAELLDTVRHIQKQVNNKNPLYTQEHLDREIKEYCEYRSTHRFLNW